MDDQGDTMDVQDVQDTTDHPELFGRDVLIGSVYCWQRQWGTRHGDRVELVQRDGKVWLHATDDDGDAVVIELPPRVIQNLGSALAQLAS